MQNLWPDFSIEEAKGPKAILVRQAGYLEEKTKRMLSGDIVTKHRDGEFIHSFYIVAPKLDGYRYRLFRIKHGPAYYPLAVIWDEEEKEENAYHRNEPYFPDAADEGEFLRYLSEIFRDKRTVKIVSSLMSLSEDEMKADSSLI